MVNQVNLVIRVHRVIRVIRVNLVVRVLRVVVVVIGLGWAMIVSMKKKIALLDLPLTKSGVGKNGKRGMSITNNF